MVQASTLLSNLQLNKMTAIIHRATAKLMVLIVLVLNLGCFVQSGVTHYIMDNALTNVVTIEAERSELGLPFEQAPTTKTSKPAKAPKPDATSDAEPRVPIDFIGNVIEENNLKFVAPINQYEQLSNLAETLETDDDQDLIV